MAHDVFISHSVKPEDQEAADRFYEHLERKNITCFMDTKNLVAGVPYPEVLTEAIEKSRVVLLVFSANSDNSRAVQNEMAIAAKSRIPVIPFRIEDTEPHKLLFFLASPNWLNGFPPPLEEHFPKLVKAVEHHLGMAGKVSEPKDEAGAVLEQPDGWVKDHGWHDISFDALSRWVKDRMMSGEVIKGKTFEYRWESKSQQIQRRLR